MNTPQFSNFLVAATDQYMVLGWIVLLPLLGAILNGLFGRYWGRNGVYLMGVATVGTSFLLSLLAFAVLIRAGHTAAADAVAAGAGGAEAGTEHPAVQLSYVAWEWFKAPLGGGTSAVLKFRYVLDSLSAVMLLVVTGVGFLIHVYSTGYMAHDEAYARFFAYLNLFMFSMLNLILADSLVLLFVGWEGVGLCSYLLIGFWYTNSQYASAGRKAFIVNRIGDVGVILGITILAWKAGAYEFSALRDSVATDHSAVLSMLGDRTDLDEVLASWISSAFNTTSQVPWLYDKIHALIPNFSWGGLACFLLFVGCTGKSAQIPLYVWLPDAMAGPTPVSALIHAATMVTAGVYLLCRMSFLYVHFPSVMAVVAIIGALTALLAATIAVAQNELKKVLAYSTVSQLGFMFIGCGVGAFGAGLFHVYTHAMFKACLFLGAGAVMHACRDKQDLRELGGLKKYLPLTYATFAVATLAIIGTPGLSGFFSKDEILFRALANTNVVNLRVPWALIPGGTSSQHPDSPLGFVLWRMPVGPVAFWLGIIAATLTAFYMCRLLFLTFWGDFKGWSLDKASYAKGVAGAKGGATDGAGDEEEQEEEDEHEAGASSAAKTGGHDDGHGAHGGGHGDGHGEGNPWDPPKDNPWNITGVLIALAGLAVVAGYVGIPWLFTHHKGVLASFLEPSIREWHVDHAAMAGKETMAMSLGVLAFAVGSGAAYYVYVMQSGAPARQLAGAMPRLYRLVVDKWRVDELYDVVFVRPLRWASNAAADVFDPWIIDLLVKIVGWIPRLFGAILRKAQTGTVHVYGAVIALGLLAILGWNVVRPNATIAYRAQGNHLTLQAYGGPGYSYEWDLRGDGNFGDRTQQTQQQVDCTPTDAEDGRRLCRVGLRVHNAFGNTAVVTRTIEMAIPQMQEQR